MNRRVIPLLLALCLLPAAGCASWPRRWGTQPCCIENKAVVRRQSIQWHLFDMTAVEPLKRCLDFARIGRRVVGGPVRARNLRGGEVADSTFFTNRDISALTADQVRWGPTRPEDLPVAPYTITKPKIEGKTAGFFVKDARGERYLFKLDSAENPELLSGAEAVTSKLIHALGYNVPVYEALRIPPGELRIGEQARFKKPDGSVEPFTPELLREVLDPRLRDGGVRLSATKILAGEILGPAPFKKFRDCAEMRALKVAYAWLNNVDTKDHNSLLVWDGTKTVGYLFDFGTALGADAGLGAAKLPCEGVTYAFDFKEMALELVTLGRHRAPCDADIVLSPALGRLAPRVNPDVWKPYAPNSAFKELNEQDARWMSRRIARLSREQIAAAVSAGAYSRPEDAQRLIELLISRRDSIVNRYLEEDERDDP